ncbi:hypothetical protein Bca52824_012008 [Brassica carinata]|uniref:Uncharacterized protein n=1 Tax=Brassica carinata TaxID=52824 RepID=A0A8X7VXV0_BRACI|nr:hypothetical protein Bca52824_012008 [Brassica carinata]
MALEQEAEAEAEAGRETSSVSTRFIRNRDLYLFLPSLLGFSDGNDNVASWRERIILVNPFTQGMIVLEESSGLNPLLRDLLEPREEGHPPASRASIDAMRVVDVDGWGGECVICLEERKEEDTAKEMPCTRCLLREMRLRRKEAMGERFGLCLVEILLVMMVETVMVTLLDLVAHDVFFIPRIKV